MEELPAALLRVQVGSGWLCSTIPQLGVQCLAKHLDIETAGEGQHLPDLLRAAIALLPRVAEEAPAEVRLVFPALEIRLAEL